MLRGAISAYLQENLRNAAGSGLIENDLQCPSLPHYIVQLWLSSIAEAFSCHARIFIPDWSAGSSMCACRSMVLSEQHRLVLNSTITIWLFCRTRGSLNHSSQRSDFVQPVSTVTHGFLSSRLTCDCLTDAARIASSCHVTQ